MARKRKLDAGLMSPEPAQEEGPTMGGMWGGTAMNMLRRRLSETQEDIVNGILSGTLALELDPVQVKDLAGTDRVGDWKKDPEFKALVENIKRRGQTQAIRVRPLDDEWRPDPDNPLSASGEGFIIQSGRRRLAACAALEIKVRAVISTDMGDRALADLEERFHENTMRKNLNGFEELLSVGLIAQALGDLSQAEIAARLGVSQNDVSLGLSCVELHAKIVAAVDIENTPKRAYREIIPKLRQGKSAAAVSPTPVKPKPAEAKTKNAHVTVTSNGSKFAVTLKTKNKVDEGWLAQAIADLVDREG